MAQQEVLSASQRNLLSRATSATSEPTPGYVYKDITDMVLRDPAILPTVEDYLLQKLARNEPYIKFKCLKLLKNLCARLPHEFNRNKVCHCHAVIEARTYKAPYSEHNGDYLCQMVRNEVEDLLKVIYGQQNASAAGGVPPSIPPQNRMIGFGNMPMSQSSANNQFGSTNPANQNYSLPNTYSVGYGNQGGIASTGFGNTAYGNQGGIASSGVGNMGFGNTAVGSPAYGNAGAGRKMEGFGNFKSKTPVNKSTSNQAFKVISDVANRFIPTSIMDKIERVSSAFTSTTLDQIERHVTSAFDKRKSTMQEPYAGSFANTHRPVPAFVQPSFNTQPERTLLPSLIPDAHAQHSTVEDVSGEIESKLVKDILTFSGIKVSPSQQIIDDFLMQLKDANVRYVVDELLRSINNRANRWQLQLRILCIFEALIVRANMADDVISHLATELQPILVKCREESQLKNKAYRVMQLLNSAANVPPRDVNLISTTSPTERKSPTAGEGVNTSSASELDLFASDVVKADDNNQNEPLRSIPSDFTNPAFDLLDSFTPVSSIRTPQESQASNAPKTTIADDILDFENLAISTAKNRTSTPEHDLFAALDTVAFQPQARGTNDLL
ncbi:hypothetical protein, conserved [Babesia bigemina]|uniref:ENTH domain-containing protein n=1 Tax=Babesia bigemina TaxID=5866 RepID=A0A061D4G3_BABBI|nr:hypothetical protein, conserved [Babesia bigemina]CDR93819.1 hypothetical protein, conserved [Babesia bigemina]|eukprot:XP_012766005.1 hypothetical protein, conserved [Babesia bigemina]